MKYSKLIKWSRLIVFATIVLAAQPEVKATIINDLTTPTTVTINGGVFKTDSFQTAGTGVIQPFIRVQNKGSQAGYNTSLGTPLDVDNSWNNNLLLSSLQSVIYNGIAYYDFRLDLNQAGSEKASQITLNQVEIYGSATPAPATGVTVDPNTGHAVNGNLLGTKIWDMNPNGDSANAILLDFNLNKGGSGEGDMQMLIPVSLFANLNYVVLYSQFGKNPIPDGTESNAGFEEWIAVTGPNVTSIPEPSTVIAGALLLVPLGVQALRSYRSRKQ